MKNFLFKALYSIVLLQNIAEMNAQEFVKKTGVKRHCEGVFGSCPFCGKKMRINGLGMHKKYCHSNPNCKKTTKKKLKKNIVDHQKQIVFLQRQLDLIEADQKTIEGFKELPTDFGEEYMYARSEAQMYGLVPESIFDSAVIRFVNPQPVRQLKNPDFIPDQDHAKMFHDLAIEALSEFRSID